MLEITNVSKKYGDRTILPNGINFYNYDKAIARLSC